MQVKNKSFYKEIIVDKKDLEKIRRNAKKIKDTNEEIKFLKSVIYTWLKEKGEKLKINEYIETKNETFVFLTKKPSIEQLYNLLKIKNVVVCLPAYISLRGLKSRIKLIVVNYPTTKKKTMLTKIKITPQTYEQLKNERIKISNFFSSLLEEYEKNKDKKTKLKEYISLVEFLSKTIFRIQKQSKCSISEVKEIFESAIDLYFKEKSKHYIKIKF